MSATAQTPGFRFGPRFSMGASRFTQLSGTSRSLALQANLVASKQITNYFAIEFCPWTGMISSERAGLVHDGTTPNGRSRIYTYHDIYHVYSVGFPLLAKFSVGFRHTYFSAFAGPSIAFNMGGTHSKQYDDEVYNLRDGYSGHSMTELARSMNSGIVGVGIAFERTKGILGLDLQLNQYVSQVGQFEGAPYEARSLMIGLSWIH